MLFLEASEQTLVTRYKETRRRHPLAPEGSVAAGVAAERSLLEPLRERADVVIDTTGMSAATLRERIASELLPHKPGRLSVTFMSFGFKHGPPREEDLAFDVRFLANPHYEPELRDLTGLDQPVVDYIARDGRLAAALRAPVRAAGLPAAAVRRRGQGAHGDRDRLHGRAAPLGRDRRAPRRSATAASTSSTWRSPTATSSAARAAS